MDAREVGAILGIGAEQFFLEVDAPDCKGQASKPGRDIPRALINRGEARHQQQQSEVDRMAHEAERAAGYDPAVGRQHAESPAHVNPRNLADGYRSEEHTSEL